MHYLLGEKFPPSVDYRAVLLTRTDWRAAGEPCLWFAFELYLMGAAATCVREKLTYTENRYQPRTDATKPARDGYFLMVLMFCDIAMDACNATSCGVAARSHVEHHDDASFQFISDGKQ